MNKVDKTNSMFIGFKVFFRFSQMITPHFKVSSKPLTKKNSDDVQRIQFAHYPNGPVGKNNPYDINTETSHYRQHDGEYGKDYSLLIENLKLLLKDNPNKLQLTKKKGILDNDEKDSLSLASRIINNQGDINQARFGFKFPTVNNPREISPQYGYINRGKIKSILRYFQSQLISIYSCV